MTDITGIPALWAIVAIILVSLFATGVVVYALYAKGDVSAKLSHGLTSFELQAKEKPKPKIHDR